MVVKKILNSLSVAAQSRDREAVSTLIEDLGRKLGEVSDLDESDIVDRLEELRSNRWFAEIDKVVTLSAKAGVGSPATRRHYAQSLIESKQFDRAVALIQSIIDDTSAKNGEHSQALGLMGRAFKQIYIDRWDGAADPAQEAALRNAVQKYRQGFELNHSFEERNWHGINLAALLFRSESDGFSVENRGEWRTIAEGLLNEITQKSGKSGNKLKPWDYATAGEAAFAIGDTEKAEHWFELYRNSKPDDFQIEGTVRQLREIWNKRIDDPDTGGMLLRLQSVAAHRENCEIEISGEELVSAQSLANEKEILFPQGRVNDADFTSIHWFVQGLERAKAVVRIGRNEEEGVGTGFVVRARDLLDDVANEHARDGWPEFVVLTNAHVVTDDVETRLEPPDGPDGRQLYAATAPAKALVSFQSQRSLDGKWPTQHRVNQLWTSPFAALDITVLEIKDWIPPDDFKPCPIAGDAPSSRNSRILVIGHPFGNGLKFSTEGSDYLGHSHEPDSPDPSKKMTIRYASPTEGGSSGSPVFEEEDWSVLGIHQGMVTNVDGPDGKFSANQAIWIETLRHQLSAA